MGLRLKLDRLHISLRLRVSFESFYLFALVMNELTIHIQDDVMSRMLFADDIVIVDETKQSVYAKLEIWGEALDSKGFKTSRNRTKNIESKFSNNRNTRSEEVQL